MPKSYRIRTSVDGTPGSDKTIRVQIDQDFDFLEVLSLKLTQSDVYQRFCADYGVIVGRVVANGGFGVPNARVSVFVPLDDLDENDPVISTLYPYKSITDKNEDGYRYNLLPYSPSYDGHAATGTFPTREDVLTRKEVLKIYDKYYKYTVKTNESGDYMIVGVPLGNQQIFLDVDLSDMGCFSLRPTDLIRMGRANEKQFDGAQFKTSEDLASLPQIVTQTKSVAISSFWGVQGQCDVGITRVDFDLRESNITIEPVATFMGSIMSSSKETYLRKSCKPKSEQGDLCGMVAGPGRILAIRQTIRSDADGDPILEQYQLEQGGKVIDENGAFVVDVPMNLDYVTTNEFGELTLSNDPKIGIPTKGKYRFKIKWEDGEKELGAIQTSESLIGPGLLNLQAFNPKGELQRANYLIPNIKEYGWENSTDDPNKIVDTYETFTFTNESLQTEEITEPFNNPQGTTLVLDKVEGQYEKLEFYIKGPNATDSFEKVNSKWLDIPNGGQLKIILQKKRKTITFGSGTQTFNSYYSVRLNFTRLDYRKALLQKSYSFSLNWNDYPDKQEAISCKDFFYEFTYNKVYTTAQLIDEYRKGKNSGGFLSIKEILDRSCESEVNKFPVNDGVRNFDLLFLVIQSLFQIISILAFILIPVYSLVKFLWNNFAVFIAAFFIAYCGYKVVTTGVVIAGLINAGGPVLGSILRESLELLVWAAVGVLTGAFFKKITRLRLGPIKFPMITYPDCSSCDCGDYEVADGPPIGEINTSYLADINTPSIYQPYGTEGPFTEVLISQGYGQIAAGRDDKDSDSEADGARTPRYEFRNNDYWTSGKLDPDQTGNGDDCATEDKQQYTLPIPERVNLYNTKAHYFNNTSGGMSNRIKIYPNYSGNGATVSSYTNAAFYEDQPLVVLCDRGFLSTFSAGTMLSFVSANNTKDINVSGVTSEKNLLGTRNVTGSTPTLGTTKITIQYADPSNSSNLIPITKQFTIQQNLYSGVTSYNFPSDIEYYQIVTGYTLLQLSQIVNGNTIDYSYYNNSFYRRVIKGEMNVAWAFRDEENDRVIGNSFCNGVDKQIAIDQIPQEIRNNLVAVVMMKGVDPYSPRQRTKIDVSRVFGTKEGTMVTDLEYKLNIPIQPDLNLKQHTDYTSNVGTQIFYPSYFFTPSTQTTTEKNWRYSAFTTNNHRLYSSYNGSKNTGNDKEGNKFLTPGIDGYYPFEYVGGGSEMARVFFKTPVGYYLKYDDGEYKRKNERNEDVGDSKYYRSVYTPTGNTLNMSSNVNIVMRTDRLPRSDAFDNNFVLAQNKAFAMYVVPDKGYADVPLVAVANANDFSRGQSEDFQEDYGSQVTSVLSSFSCDSIVPLGAYEQLPGQALRIKPKPNPVYDNGGVQGFPKVVKGCYVVCERDLAIAGDLEVFSEWKARYILGFALCRNIFGMTFTNQWVNGVLYMPGFQNDRIYRGLDTTSRPGAGPNAFGNYDFCKDKITFRLENNSFFYRSSPFNQIEGKFIGKDSGQTDPKIGSNKYFLGNPTTIVDLGPKDNLIKFVCAKPEFQGYYMDTLKPSSYNSISDLAQFFVVSRLANAKFLQLMFSAKSGSVSQLFSRNGKKIDGDFAQLNSINSEIGVTPFSPETYKDENLFYDGRPDATIGVFFTASTTTRDYITPGRQIFIDTPTKFAYDTFGIKSQIVPMYRWKLDNQTVIDGKISIFGSEKNEWLTDDPNKFVITPYQGIDRLNDGTYYKSSVKNPTTQRPGYIYDSSGLTDSKGVVTGFTFDGFADPGSPNEIMVGAPFHFYFGLKAGKTAYDIFVKRNLIDL